MDRVWRVKLLLITLGVPKTNKNNEDNYSLELDVNDFIVEFYDDSAANLQIIMQVPTAKSLFPFTFFI